MDASCTVKVSDDIVELVVVVTRTNTMVSMWGNENIVVNPSFRSLVKSNSPLQEVSDLSQCTCCYGRDTHQQVSQWGRVEYSKHGYMHSQGSYAVCELTRCLCVTGHFTGVAVV